MTVKPRHPAASGSHDLEEHSLCRAILILTAMTVMTVMTACAPPEPAGVHSFESRYSMRAVGSSKANQFRVFTNAKDSNGVVAVCGIAALRTVNGPVSEMSETRVLDATSKRSTACKDFRGSRNSRGSKARGPPRPRPRIA
jgi:hypothetical protein